MKDIKIDNIMIIWEMDPDPDVSWLDESGLQKLYRGDMGFEGCYCVAEVSYDCGQGCRRLESLYSSGLWGIVSFYDDANAVYRKEIETEELADLKAHLKAFGINVNDFDNMSKQLNSHGNIEKYVE